MRRSCMKGTGWIRFFAVLDLLVTAPLAMPGLTRPWTHMLLSAAGQLPVPDPWLLPAPSAVLFAQLLGVLGLCWNGARLAWPYEIGRAHVCTPVPNAHLVCRLLLEKKNLITHSCTH